jgi:hypothetical protein
MHKYVFIDESGDLGLNGSNYLILAALLVADYLPLDRIIKNMRRNKFKKELRKAQEIRACKSSKEVIRSMLLKLGEVENVKIMYVVLEKRKVFSEFLRNDKNKLYNYVAGKLARNLPDDEADFEIRIDKSKGKQLLQQDFNNYFKKILSTKSKIVIEHSYSHCWAGLQFADVLAWACFQKFEHANSDYVDLIKAEQEVYHVW